MWVARITLLALGVAGAMSIFSPLPWFGSVPDAALLRHGGFSVLLMVLHKLESFYSNEIKHDIFYSRLKTWIAVDDFSTQRAFFLGFCPAYCLGLVLLMLVMRGPPWPMLCVFAYIAQCSHEVHHLAKAVVRRGYYPGAVTALAFVGHSHLLLAGARRCAGLGPEWQAAYLATQLVLGVLFARQYRAFLFAPAPPQRCLILGASRGLGCALARELHARDCELVLVSRTESGLTPLAKELDAVRWVGDVRDERFMVAHHGHRTDLVVSCAGTSVSDLDGGLENTFGLADAVLERTGRLVVVGSLAGLVNLPEPHAVYSARKHFSHAYVNSRRASCKYPVTLVCPGPLRTQAAYARAAAEIIDRLEIDEQTMALGLGGRVLAKFGWLVPASWLLPFC